MKDSKAADDVTIALADFVATVEISRPPHNFFDFDLIHALANAFESLDRNSSCRAIVLAAQGKSFCAGSNFGDADDLDSDGQVRNRPQGKGTVHLYTEAVRLFRTQKPIVAAVHGSAIGGGLGLALVADFRVTSPDARFSANFTRLGIHPGFGLSVTLPDLIGKQNAALMLYTGRRIKGDEALRLGLADILVPPDEVRLAAYRLAGEIAQSAPLAVAATRATLRQGLADRVRAAIDRELPEQTRLRKTQDFKEGVKATAERRQANFTAS